MASSDTPTQIMASEDKQMVLKEGLAACSEYTRADMITLTNVTQASSRRRRLSTNNLVVVFEITVVADAWGFDESTVQQLYDLVATNLTQHINDGSFNDAVVEAATDLGVTITVTADPQIVSATYITVTIPTPDWFTGTAAPSGRAEREADRRKERPARHRPRPDRRRLRRRQLCRDLRRERLLRPPHRGRRAGAKDGRH